MGVVFISFQRIERYQKPVSHGGSREPGDVLTDGVGSHVLNRVHEGGIVEGERSREKWLSGEEHNRETVTREPAHKVAHDFLCRLDTVRFDVFGEHGLGYVEHDGDVDSFFGHIGSHRRTYRICKDAHKEREYGEFQHEGQVEVFPFTLPVDLPEQFGVSEVDSFFPGAEIRPDEDGNEEEEEEKRGGKEGHRKEFGAIYRLPILYERGDVMQLCLQNCILPCSYKNRWTENPILTRRNTIFKNNLTRICKLL